MPIRLGIRAVPVALLCTFVAVAGCSGGKKKEQIQPSERSHPILGTVLDERTGKPIAGAVVVAGDRQATTSAAGAFRLEKALGNGAALTATAKGYRPRSAPQPTKKPYAVTIKLDPTVITVAVSSNLTHKPLDAYVTGGGSTVRAVSGAARIHGVGTGDSIRVTADGYNAQIAKLGSDSKVSIVLVAGPKASAVYLASAQINQKYKVQADFVYPDEYKFVSRASLIMYLKKADHGGYGLVRWNVKSVAIVPSWRFPGCSGRGAKTYKQVAAVEFTSVNSAPGGKSQATHGVEHLVQDRHGQWDWFPIVPGCE